ncbi:MAG: TetR/AcrR family transcriptional regulator [Candidatus Moduliflexus flocculans]|nr:TetR/AcrR family transcriptional regulator [Candidatus Moduliflexus flocculans]
MTMQDVARQVGIGKGTIYLHFPSKEELVLAHIDRIARDRRPEAPGDGRLALIPRRESSGACSFSASSTGSTAWPTTPRALGDLLSSVRAPLLVAPAGRTSRRRRPSSRTFSGTGQGSAALDCPDPRTTSLVLIHSTNSLLPVQPLAPGARPAGGAGGPGRPHRRSARQGTPSVPVAPGQLDALKVLRCESVQGGSP